MATTTIIINNNKNSKEMDKIRKYVPHPPPPTPFVPDNLITNACSSSCCFFIRASQITVPNCKLHVLVGHQLTWHRLANGKHPRRFRQVVVAKNRWSGDTCYGATCYDIIVVYVLVVLKIKMGNSHVETRRLAGR